MTNQVKPQEPPSCHDDNHHRNLYSLIPHYPPFKPIKPPSIDIAFTTKPFLFRTTEALIYSVRKMEYSLSPKGSLRQWFKLNLLIMLWLLVPAITITPVFIYLTTQISTFTMQFNHIIQNLFQAFIPLCLISAVISLIIIFIRR